ncbi:FAD-dependent 5-carboxymethylaminomethyl-2-thiouridine(34) oxidoreductase MnmC [Acinetobacter sp. YH12085]|uniref:FAD-dependent 5-carboxymethylaminomethyl-2-thiouridine(34) oxidoreductase MnmC n=1 Tax=Acinetobacter sp. YH12085 TaxID=2601077 RepID=UPI0015D1CB61|nr:FAD-dependent 5-carboxymethylaminomethyl-2-thiouridine(34) oxidoreductase MnmC [Acinetobacter sp. YH12085]
MSGAIQTADLDWQMIDGIDIPVSKQFGDVYFSKDNGLLETRHVFLKGNDLDTRLAALTNFEYFSVGETGFGTGLNILALWQLWQQVRPDNHSHLHAISVEKFPLSKADLIRALNAWPELQPLAQQLIAQYPEPIAGCHRLNFPEERFSIDLWLGDAHDVFPVMAKTATVNAWFLDGFAPACNPDMWEENVLKNIVRLSDIGTTFASFSVAGVLKRGLREHGITITRPRGFAHKREMLKAFWLAPEKLDDQSVVADIPTLDEKKNSEITVGHKPRQIAIIGAGIAGLSCAWAFAQRGHQVRIYEKSAPLSGGSGNPLALLNPKLCPIEQSAEHLMTLSWLYALKHYQNFKAFRPLQIHQSILKNKAEHLDLAQSYPSEVLAAEEGTLNQLASTYPTLLLKQAGAVSPHQLRDQILAHPHIELLQADIQRIEQQQNGVALFTQDQQLPSAEHVILCAARDSMQLQTDYPELRAIRGQVSWLNNRAQQMDMHTAYSYGGYCMQLDAEQMIMGASFYPGRDDTDVLTEDHVHNYELIHSVFPDFAKTLVPIEQWQGRAAIRAQTKDFFPVIGAVHEDQQIYSCSGLGSKGFLYAPLCSEIIAALVLKEACPIPTQLLDKIHAARFIRRAKAKQKTKKPYFQGQMLSSPPQKNNLQ